jgi:hypothetical protein
MNKELIYKLRRREASTAVGPSTARRMGPKGTISAAQEYLASLNLARFRVNSDKESRAALDQATECFLDQLPAGGKHWGAARKFLNIFLRNVIYNRFLCEHYGLIILEPWLELPLDSQVAKGLREEANGRSLPRWKTVIGLDRETNKKFQEFATSVAAKESIHRVHLDIKYWRRDFVDATKTVETHPKR